MTRSDILAAIPHTHRNRWLSEAERSLLERCHARREHRDAERKMHQ